MAGRQLITSGTSQGVKRRGEGQRFLETKEKDSTEIPYCTEPDSVKKKRIVVELIEKLYLFKRTRSTCTLRGAQ